jgi:hypothetical protein
MAKSGKAKNARRPSRAAQKKAAPRRVRPVPAGYHTATPYLTVRGAAEAIELPFGHAWGLATHKEDVPPREIARRAQAAMAGTGEAKA